MRITTRLCLLICALLAHWLVPAPARTQDAPRAGDMDIIVQPPGPVQPVTPATPHDVAVTIRCDTLGHLYLSGRHIEMTAGVTSQITQRVAVTELVTNAYGAQIYLNDIVLEVGAGQTITQSLDFDGSSHLPNGIYRIEVWAAGETQGLDITATDFGVWSGPANTLNDTFGINYLGPLDSDRTWRDLDLMKMAGIGSLRFQLQGWLPQGQTKPVEAEQYNTFVEEATNRGFHLLAAFTPRLTLDPGVNPVQASKDYRESLLAAVTRYGFTVKDWELLTVKPDPRYPELHGVRYQELAEYYKALKIVDKDKSLRVLFPLEHPFKWNAKELFNDGLPGKQDLFGIHYDFSGIPEYMADATPPTFALDEIRANAQDALKRTPAAWVTDYGFEAKSQDRLPDSAIQAALTCRALLLDRAQGIQRTFWRHNVNAPVNRAFTNADGSVSAGLLALRTTLAMLNDVTQISPVESPGTLGEGMPQKVWTMLLRVEPKAQKGEKRGKPHYILVAWTETRDSRITGSITLHTPVTRLRITDLWGNSFELQPTSNAAVMTVDAFPRFVDLGESNDIEILTPFARFEPSALKLTDGGENRLGLTVRNDSRIFHAKITCELYLRRWPGEEIVVSKKADLNPDDSVSLIGNLKIPTNPRRGMIYEVQAEIKLGTRRIGYLTMPVWYGPKAEEK